MIIADTGFWLALASRKDKHHRRATAVLEQLREPLITTWPVMSETCHLLLTRIGPQAQLKFVENFVAGAYAVFDLSTAHHARLLTLMRGYADLPMDLADASLVILAEHLGHGRIVSTDARDFHTYRWQSNRRFENLLGV